MVKSCQSWMEIGRVRGGLISSKLIPPFRRKGLMIKRVTQKETGKSCNEEGGGYEGNNRGERPIQPPFG